MEVHIKKQKTSHSVSRVDVTENTGKKITGFYDIKDPVDHT